MMAGLCAARPSMNFTELTMKPSAFHHHSESNAQGRVPGKSVHLRFGELKKVYRLAVAGQDPSFSMEFEVATRNLKWKLEVEFEQHGVSAWSV